MIPVGVVDESRNLYVRSVLTATPSNIAIQHYLRYLVDDLLL